MNDSAAALRRRTRDFALRNIRLVRSLPKTEEARTIGRQLLRSGTSIGANHRAAARGRSRAEFVAKLGIVLEEADETVYWLELLAESGIVPAKRLQDITREATELVKIFSASRRTLRD